MKEKPISLTLLFYSCILIAVSFPLQIFITEGHHLNQLGMVYSKLAPLNILSILSLFSVSLSIILAPSILKLTLPVCTMIILLNNLNLALAREEMILQSITASLGFILLISVLIFGKGLNSILRPELNWWRIPKRLSLDLSLCKKTLENSKQLNELTKQIPAISTYNISRNGIFIPLNKEIDHEMITKLKNKSFELSLIDDNNQLSGAQSKKNIYNLKFKVVRISKEKKGVYPPGIGLKLVGGNIADILRWKWAICSFSTKVSRKNIEYDLAHK